MPADPQYAASARRFLAALPDWLERLRHEPTSGEAAAKQKMIVVLGPWSDCPVGLYSLFLGMAIHARRGAEVEFLVDDIAYPMNTPLHEGELKFLLDAGRIAEGAFRFRRLSEFAPAEGAEAKTIATEAADRSIATDLEHRVGNRILADTDRAAFTRTAHPRATDKALRLLTCLGAAGAGSILIPGGLVNGSWIYFAAARHHGMRCPTFDSGPGLIQVSMDSIAGQQRDIRALYEALQRSDDAERRFCRDRAWDIINRRMSGGDAIMTVDFERNLDGDFDVVICMNFEGDTAAIGLDLIYTSAADWLEDTLGTIHAHAPQTRVVVRQHPDERRLTSQQTEAALQRVRALAERGVNVRIVTASENVSTYHLMEKAKLVIVGTSTIGIEAAMLGKHVVVIRDAYYSNENFVTKAVDRATYVAAIEQALDTSVAISEDRIFNASLMYYALEGCNRLWTRFTPIPSDFERWIDNDPLGILADPVFLAVVDAVGGHLPTTIATHRAQYAPKAD